MLWREQRIIWIQRRLYVSTSFVYLSCDFFIRPQITNLSLSVTFRNLVRDQSVSICMLQCSVLYIWCNGPLLFNPRWKNDYCVILFKYVLTNKRIFISHTFSDFLCRAGGFFGMGNAACYKIQVYAEPTTWLHWTCSATLAYCTATCIFAQLWLFHIRQQGYGYRSGFFTPDWTWSMRCIRLHLDQKTCIVD